MLDLSAAFDTVNHDTLTKLLHKELALRWVESYLHNRVQKVGINGSICNPFNLCCGDPQGLCLGLILFIICASKLFEIIEHDLASAHCILMTLSFI